MDSNEFDRLSSLEDTSEELAHIDTLADAENGLQNFALLRDDIAEILWTISQPESNQASDHSPDFSQEPEFELSDFEPSEFDLSDFEVNDSIQGLPSSISSRATLLPENLVSMEEAEGSETLNIKKPTDFSRAIRPGSHLLPPLENPERPSTISRMEDNVNFDISEFFDLDAAAVPATPSVAQIPVNPITGEQSSNAIPPSGTPQDIYSPSVNFPEYLRQSQNLSMKFNPNALADKHGHQKLPVMSSVNDTAAVKIHKFRSKAANKDDCFKNAFKAGAKDGFLPAMSDPLYDAELAAFAAAGIKATAQSSKEAKKRAPVPPEDVNYTKISQIYVSDILRRESELLGNPSNKPSSYTAEQVQWAKNYLTDEAKAWLRNACDATTIKSDISPIIVADDDQPLQQSQNVAPSGLSSSKPASQIPRLPLSCTMSATSSGLPDYTCVRCDKDLTTKTHLLEHISKNDCQAGAIKRRKIREPAGASNFQSSMTDEEFVANGLPDVQAKNLRGLPYCEACSSEFSIVSRLRSHVLRSCPVLRERGTYNTSLPEIDNKVNHFPFAGYSPQGQIESATGSDRNVTVGDLLAFNKSRSQSNTSANLLSAVRHLTQNNYNTGPTHRSSGHQVHSIRQGNSASPQLLEISNTKRMEGREQGLKYPERVRLFSKEITQSSPRMSDQLEEFEDLPQNTNRFNTQQSSETSPGDNKTSSQFKLNNASGNISTVYFVFTNKGNYAAAVRKLEAVLLKTSVPKLQSLKLWPSPSVLPPQSKETFEFKITATDSVNLVSILREIFPDMAVKKLGKKVIFLRQVVTSANALAPAFSSTEAYEAAAEQPESDNMVEKLAIEQPQRGSRSSTDLPDSVSLITVKTKVTGEQKGPDELQRGRSSSRLSEQRGEPENSDPSNKKRQKKN